MQYWANKAVWLGIIGVLLYLVNRFVPMHEAIKAILNAVVIIGVVIWILNLLNITNIHF